MLHDLTPTQVNAIENANLNVRQSADGLADGGRWRR